MIYIVDVLNMLEAKGITLALNSDDNLVLSGNKEVLSPDMIAEIRNSKQAIVSYLKSNQIDDFNDLIPVLPRNGETLLASYSQQRLWLLDQIEGGSAHYNMPGALKLVGRLDYVALQRAFASILARHESLRTRFCCGEDGMPRQLIMPVAPCEVGITDLSGLAAQSRDQELAERIAAEAARPFDLSADLMLRASLIKLGNEEHMLLVTMHHIASDGWSLSILFDEFRQLYQAFVQGQPDPLPPLTIQYADYAAWQRQQLQGEVQIRQLDYWARQLDDLPVVHSLPLDFPRPRRQTFAGDNVISWLDQSLTAALNTLCQRTGVTLFMALHAAFSVLLARTGNERDIVLGTAVANREHEAIAGLIGFFVNTLVLRSDLSGDPSFHDVLQHSKQTLLDAYDHQAVPFDHILERLQTERAANHAPMFQIMLGMENPASGSLQLPGLTLTQVGGETGIAKFDLSLSISERDQRLRLDWEYNTGLFKAASIERMAQRFGRLLAGLLSAPQQPVFTVPMLGEDELDQLLRSWNDTACDFPHTLCIHEVFEQQVRRHPQAVALTHEGNSLSFDALNRRANQVAHYLRQKRQVGPDTLIGLCFERSLEMVVGLLGILKAGAAYVPLDPDYPAARLSYMLADAGLDTVLTQTALRAATPVPEAMALCLDDPAVLAMLQQCDDRNPAMAEEGRAPALQPHHLAYVIYTSGSTGNPKGVMIEHRSLVNLAQAWGRRFCITPADSVLQFAPISFDMSVEEIFGALCNGARLVLRGADWIGSAHGFWQHCAENGITMLNLPTAYWHELARETAAPVAASVQRMGIGGEKLSDVVAQQWFARNETLPLLVNGYGPTECTVDATFIDVTPEGSNSIGRALDNTSLFVLSAHGMPQPVGVPGELHIGGVSLARGYLNRPDLTEEKFIPNPFYRVADPASSSRLYKTGDLVRWQPDGTLEYLGRLDHQVKIRGFRIELGEIEKALNAHVEVTDSVVLARVGPGGDNRLVAWLVVCGQSGAQAGLPGEPGQELIERLRQYLGQSLPEYMVPAAFVLLDKWPLTPNGKVDRKALPQPDLSQSQGHYVAPGSETEEFLCQAWQEVLGLERVGILDNFFRLGGHSLLATRLVARINQALAIQFSLKALFQCDDLMAMARAVDELLVMEKNKLLQVSEENSVEVEW